jgi:hypothetical protein
MRGKQHALRTVNPLALIVANLEPLAIIFRFELSVDLGARLLEARAKLVGHEKIAHIVDMFIQIMVYGKVETAPRHQI